MAKKFKFHLTASAREDLEYFNIREQREIVDGIETFLGYNADVQNKRRKQLKPNAIGEWELRIGKYRVFYDFEAEHVVKIIAVGYKEHNDLLIRGKKVEL